MQNQQPQQKKFSVWLFIFLFLVAFVRYFPIYMSEGKWWADSALNGNFAYQFTKGHVILDFFAYQLPHYLHGSQVINILLIPFYYFGGPYYGWISFIGLLISSAIFAFSVSLFRWETKEKSDGAIAFVLIFFFLPPPVYTYFMRTLWANHFETTFFFITSLTLFCWAARKEQLKVPLLLLGLFLGFSCFFCYTSFSFALALAISMWYLKGKNFFRNSWLFAVGFLIGFLPAILYNLTYENVITGIYLSAGAIAASYAEAAKLRSVGYYALYDLIFKVMPRFLHAELNTKSLVFSLLLGLSFIYLLWQIVIKRDKTPLKVGILITLISYTLFYTFTSYAVFDYNNVFYYRYVIFLFPAMVLAIGFLLERLRFLAPLVAFLLLITSGQGDLYRYPSSVDELKYAFRAKKGYDLARIYEQSMLDWLNKNPSNAPEVASKIMQKTTGFERVVALKGLGRFRLNLFRQRKQNIDNQVTSIIDQPNRKWLAFGWGMAQADCASQNECALPLPALLSEEEEKWFATGFVLMHFWGKNREDAYFKEAERAIIEKLSAEFLAFAFGFSASEASYSLPPWPKKPENQLEVIHEYIAQFGGLEDAFVREQFWKGAGCETAYWFLSENFLASQQIYNDLMTPPAALQSLNPDAANLAIGWQECLAEFGCRQSAYKSEIGEITEFTCE